MAATIFEKAAGLLKRRQYEMAISYDGFVDDMASERVTNEDDLLAGCEKFGKTVAEVQTDVAKRKERKQLQESIADESEVRQREAELTEGIASENAKFEALQKAHRETVGRMHSELLEVQGKLRRIATVKDKLRRTLPVKATTELSKMDQEIRTLNQQRTALQNELSRVRSQVVDRSGTGEPMTRANFHGREAELRAEQRDIENVAPSRRNEKQKSRLQTLPKELADLQAERKATEERLADTEHTLAELQSRRSRKADEAALA